jgi:hypothetical protein
MGFDYGLWSIKELWDFWRERPWWTPKTYGVLQSMGDDKYGLRQSRLYSEPVHTVTPPLVPQFRLYSDIIVPWQTHKSFEVGHFGQGWILSSTPVCIRDRRRKWCTRCSV